MSDAAAFKKFVLYIGQDARDPQRFCEGSRECLKLVEAIKQDVLVQNVDIMLERGVAIPEWLDGTPILVDTANKRALKGSDALDHLAEATTAPPASAAGEATAFEGVLPDGERYLHAEEPDSQQQPLVPDPPAFTREGKITENDVQRYMEMRKASAPGGSPPA